MMQANCRVLFWTGISGSKPPSLAIPTAIAPEKGRFALEIWNARKAAIQDASSSPGSGGSAAALTPRPGDRRPHQTAWLRQAATGTSVSVCDRRGTQDLHTESELSGPMPHFSGAMV